MKRKNERRSYYRIDDTIGLTYSNLDTTGEDRDENMGDVGMPLTSLLAEIDREFNQATNTLWHENPTLAQALGLLNRKISLIAAHSLREEDIPLDSYEELMVSISGSGLAFSCAEKLSVGTQLSLSLLLKPSDVHIACSGKVIACEHLAVGTSHPYWVRVILDGNNPAVQEQLIQHVVQKQCAQIDKNTISAN